MKSYVLIMILLIMIAAFVLAYYFWLGNSVPTETTDKQNKTTGPPGPPE
jgi:flagellar basal body-associated protein FliL